MKLLTIYKQWRPNIPYSSVVSPYNRSKSPTNQWRQNIPYNTIHKSVQLDQKFLKMNLTVPMIIIKILYNTDQEFL